ncbi:RNA recognition motif domain-containing protein [Limnovirga soli]|jgi:RNA recognition motif-containing protein|uniref:RNA-binding protein n=1 Tax=Limnovirga soli TaxID=2656915 RepID=A0A8J8FGJ1_9BACT|nr:RNA-binding protein [Limnovirga soli]NNV54684.1 RNA-binding protein [Limnovirga soli]
MNIYVSNLSFRITEEDLRKLFEQYGEVSSAKIIMDRETNRSRGFGFVEMPSEAAGKEAMQALNNKDVEGRNIAVSVAKEKSERSSDGGGGYSRGRSDNKRW